MAGVFEQAGTFTITRLRTVDAAYLQGAIQPAGPLPLPIAMARGPAAILGPGSTITDNEGWGVEVAIPAAPDVVWVIINAEVVISMDQSTGTLLVNSYLFAFGTVAGKDNMTGPVFGPGTLSGVHITTGTGAVFDSYLQPLVPAVTAGLWHPLDPDRTANGSSMYNVVRVGSTAPGVDDLRLDLSQVLLLGYPTNIWNTAALWDGTRTRGS